jgi:osmotically-inducible protein OsmY
VARGALAPAVLILAFALPGCAPSTPARKAGTDQEIAKDINWELRKDPRLEGVTAYCADGRVTLEGRVSDRAAADEALRLARRRARGGEVVDKLDVRPR